jgi:SAM-dependent methyltransferase
MAESHYDATYWEFQKEIGTIGGLLNKFKFEPTVKPEHTLLDFGCGGGFLLSNLQAAKRIGVELNPHARAHAAAAGHEVYASIHDVPSEYVDCVISNHALEHVENPLGILKELLRVLKPKGVMCLVLPCEQPSESGFYYKAGDINNHLFTWCPMTIGNLVRAAGFRVHSSIDFQHQWTPDYKTTYMRPDFHERCRAHAKQTGNRQLRVVAWKPAVSAVAPSTLAPSEPLPTGNPPPQIPEGSA